MDSRKERPTESLPVKGRLTIIEAILRGTTDIPFASISIGELVSDEPTFFNIFAFYYPLQKIGYQVVSTVGEQPEMVQPTRQKLIHAVIPEESLRHHQGFLTRIGAVDNDIALLSETIQCLDEQSLPLLMIALGQRVRDNGDATVLFYPAHISPIEPLEEFKRLVQNVADVDTRLFSDT